MVIFHLIMCEYVDWVYLICEWVRQVLIVSELGQAFPNVSLNIGGLDFTGLKGQMGLTKSNPHPRRDRVGYQLSGQVQRNMFLIFSPNKVCHSFQSYIFIIFNQSISNDAFDQWPSQVWHAQYSTFMPQSWHATYLHSNLDLCFIQLGLAKLTITSDFIMIFLQDPTFFLNVFKLPH